MTQIANAYTGNTLTLTPTTPNIAMTTGIYAGTQTTITIPTTGVELLNIAGIIHPRLDFANASRFGFDMIRFTGITTTTQSIELGYYTGTLYTTFPLALDTYSYKLNTLTGLPIPYYVFNNYLIQVSNQVIHIYDLTTTINQFLFSNLTTIVNPQSRLNKMLTNMRYTLADTGKQRWSDDRLVDLVNEAQNDLAKRSDWFKYAYTYTFTGNTIAMDISMLAIYKAEDINGNMIPFIQQDELDRLYPNWKLDIGYTADSIQYVVIDRSLTNSIVVYPSMTLTSTITITASVLPTPVDLTLNDLQSPLMFDSALMYYVTGRALRDDMDTQNRSIGNEQLALYEAEAKKLASNRVNNYKRYSNRVVKFTNPFMNWNN